MAQFTAEVFQNEFLPDGGTDVHAIVRVTCRGAGHGRADQRGRRRRDHHHRHLGLDGPDRHRARPRNAATAALNEIIDGTWFAVIAGNHVGQLVFPYPGRPAQMVRMDPSTRQAAIAIDAAFRADGGTAMGTWLTQAREVFATVPQATSGTRSCSPTAPTSTRRPTS